MSPKITCDWRDGDSPWVANSFWNHNTSTRNVVWWIQKDYFRIRLFRLFRIWIHFRIRVKIKLLNNTKKKFTDHLEVFSIDCCTVFTNFLCDTNFTTLNLHHFLNTQTFLLGKKIKFLIKNLIPDLFGSDPKFELGIRIQILQIIPDQTVSRSDTLEKWVGK